MDVDGLVRAFRLPGSAPIVPVVLTSLCAMLVLALADFIGSTGQILRRAKESPNKRIVVCTEGGILHQLRKDNPDKEFVLLSPNLVCPNMKKISLPLVLESLEEMEHRIEVPEDLRVLAVKALNRMLSYS